MSSKAALVSDQNEESARLLSTRDRARKKRVRKSACLAAVCAAGVILMLSVVVGVSLGVLIARNRLPSDPYERALALLDSYPLIDG